VIATIYATLLSCDSVEADWDMRGFAGLAWLLLLVCCRAAWASCSQDHMDFFLNEAIPHETANGLRRIQADCIRQLDQLQRLQFGPPTQWEIFNMVCKRGCRSYHDRWLRLKSQTLCDCTTVATPASWGSITVYPVNTACLPSVIDLLCKTIGFCYDMDAYWFPYCDDYACGRQSNNEASWRRCKLTHPFEQ
jgi:hypothetical protein